MEIVTAPSRTQQMVIPFVAGLFSSVSFQYGVEIIPLELIAVAFFIASLGRCSKIQDIKTRNFLRQTMIIGFILIPTQILTDAYRSITLFETIKSTAQILTLIALIFSGITWLAINETRLRSFLIGYFSSSLISFFLFSNVYIAHDSWKFLFANFTTASLLYFLGGYSKSRIVAILMVLSLVSIHLIFGARSAAAITMLCVFPLLIPAGTRPSKKNISILLIFLTVVVLASEQIYQNLALGGTLGQAQLIKAREQFESGPLLLFARSETLYQLGAITENPIIGKGSNPELDQSLLLKISRNEYQLGLRSKDTAAYRSYLLSGRVPQHSMFFGSWLEAGIIGVIFWLTILLFLLREFTKFVFMRSRLSYITFYLLISTFWNLFFSPLGAGSRLFLAIAITCVAHNRLGRSQEVRS